jgi:hypothetical protein
MLRKQLKIAPEAAKAFLRDERVFQSQDQHNGTRLPQSKLGCQSSICRGGRSCGARQLLTGKMKSRAWGRFRSQEKGRQGIGTDASGRDWSDIRHKEAIGSSSPTVR